MKGVQISMNLPPRKTILSIMYIPLICMILSLSGCSSQDAPLSETIVLKEYTLRDISVQAAGTDVSMHHIKQLSMTSEDTGWLLTADNILYHTDNGITDFKKVNVIKEDDPSSDYFVHGDFPDDASAYEVYFSSDSMIVESTTTSGNLWLQTQIPYGEYGGNGQAFLSFPDHNNGYLLYCSDPAAGQMTKILFKTKNGGAAFEAVADLSDKISGYPTGISFSSTSRGYITVTYHGQEESLFQSGDGGVTWERVSLPPYDEETAVNYIDTYPPLFWGDDRQKGKLLLKCVSDDTYCYVLYQTLDGGITWNPDGTFYGDNISSYSFFNETDGFFVDQTGKAFLLSCNDTNH